MNSDAARSWKHEIRTPINHIIGYGELIHEVAVEDGKQEVADATAELIAESRQLTQLIENHFKQMGSSHSSSAIPPAFSGSVRVAMQSLIERTESPAFAAREYQEDVKRIKQSAGRLKQMIDSCIMAGTE